MAELTVLKYIYIFLWIYPKFLKITMFADIHLLLYLLLCTLNSRFFYERSVLFGVPHMTELVCVCVCVCVCSCMCVYMCVCASPEYILQCWSLHRVFVIQVKHIPSFELSTHQWSADTMVLSGNSTNLSTWTALKWATGIKVFLKAMQSSLSRTCQSIWKK